MLHFLKRFAAIMLCTFVPAWMIVIFGVATVAKLLVPRAYVVPIDYVITAMGWVVVVMVVADLVMPASTREALLKSLR